MDPHVDAADRVALAVHLRNNDDASREAMATLCALLAEDMGRDVVPVFAHAPSALAEAMATGAAQFAWMSPTLLLMSSRLTVVPLLSSVRDGKTTFHSVVFTAGDSSIESVDDLRQARAAWVAPTSASGYLVARLTLSRRGLDLDEAIGEETFLDRHGEVARAVLRGEADIGATYAHFTEIDGEQRLVSSGFTDDDPAASARILAVGGPIPADMFVAHAGVPLRDRIAFAAALCRLANCPVGHGPVRHIVGADAFQAVSHASLAELDALMRASHDV